MTPGEKARLLQEMRGVLAETTLTSLPRAAKNAFAFKQLSGSSWSSILQEGLAMKKNQELDWNQVVLAANTPMLLKNSMVDGKPDIGVCSGGQVVGLIEDLPSCKELIDRIMHQAEEVLERMGA